MSCSFSTDNFIVHVIFLYCVEMYIHVHVHVHCQPYMYMHAQCTCTYIKILLWGNC